MRTASRWAYATLFCASLSACGGGGGSSSSVTPPVAAPNESSGGIWFGSDSEGDQILALITETGRFHFLELTTGNQGSGVVTVSNGNQISTNFRFVPAAGYLFADGSPYSDCSASGTIAERSTLNGTIDCTTSMGSQSSVTINLDYDARYELGSDLATFAGEWTDASNPGIDVVNVGSTGAITGQDLSGTGCAYSGQVSIIDSAYNAYDVEWTYSSCIGQYAALNGVTYSGIGAIDETVSPVQFTVGATGLIQGDEVSLILTYERHVGACSMAGQKQYVLDQLYNWYLWNDILPGNIDIADYTTPEELVTRVTLDFGPQDANGDPIDLFSSVGSLDADQQFFGEGKYLGFGFSWRFADPAETDFRITRTFAGSPADVGGLSRGQQVLTLNARTVTDIHSSEGISAFFDANDTVDFEVQPLVGAIFSTSITQAVVTIPPVPQWRILTGNVGYIELSTFISTADPVFDAVFQAFRNANVNDVIIDLRYNGGGLVSTAELLGDYLGGSVAQNLLFSNTEFNADRAAQNNSTEFFELLGNSISLSRLVVIATRGTASASELVTNGMIPHVDVAIVGDDTYGKPVGQIGLAFCDKILRPTSFRMANALGDGDYFDGLPVDCPAVDDLSVAVGDNFDPNMIAAMSYINTGACPVASLPGDSLKAAGSDRVTKPERRQSPHRELLDAY